ncbi:unnamed protein product, partial [marine sediment metagenome]
TLAKLSFFKDFSLGDNKYMEYNYQNMNFGDIDNENLMKLRKKYNLKNV